MDYYKRVLKREPHPFRYGFSKMRNSLLKPLKSKKEPFSALFCFIFVKLKAFH